jgi:hypothetical protein
MALMAGSILFSGVFFSLRGVVLTSLYWIVGILIIYFKQISGGIELRPQEMVMLDSLTMLVVLAVIALVADSFESAQNYYKKKMIDVEKNKVMVSFSHEFSLNISHPISCIQKELSSVICADQVDMDKMKILQKHFNQIKTLVDHVKKMEESVE